MQVVYFLPKFDFFLKGRSGRTSHAHGFVTGLAANKIDSTLVSGPGYEQLYGVPGITTKVFAPKYLSIFNVLWVMYCVVSIIRNRETNSEDSVLVVRYSTSVSSITSLLFSRFWKGTTVYEINSIGYHQLQPKAGQIMNSVLWLEKKIIAAFDIAMCVSRNISLDIANKNIQCHVLPNGSSLPRIQLDRIPRPSARFLYLGAYQFYYDFDQLFRCFEQLNSPNAQLHVYGNMEQYIQQNPSIKIQRNIEFMGTFDLQILFQDKALSSSDVFLLPNGRNRMARIGSPTKLFEYLALGGRIIYQDYGQASDILDGLDSVYPYHDDESLICALDKVAREYAHDFAPPVTASQYTSTFTWEARVREFAEFVSSFPNARREVDECQG